MVFSRFAFLDCGSLQLAEADIGFALHRKLILKESRCHHWPDCCRGGDRGGWHEDVRTIIIGGSAWHSPSKMKLHNSL